jgi:hypothetical protein
MTIAAPSPVTLNQGGLYEGQSIRVHFIKGGTLVMNFATGGGGKFAFPVSPADRSASALAALITAGSNGDNFVVDFVYHEGIARWVCEKILTGQV